MKNEICYLKGNVQIEPLVNGWHAYPLLIAPSTAAMVVANYHLPVMKSYLQMPQAHMAALKNPDMVGGPYIDHKGKKLSEVKALKEQTDKQGSGLVHFARSIKELTALLRQKAQGYPLADLYAEIPGPLKGYVELVYDLENRPSFRFIESLLYHSEYYNPTWQSIALTLVNSDDRPFIFSTPRVKEKEIVQLPIPFSDKRIDELCRLKTTPAPYGHIKEAFGISEEEEEVFRSFLTTQPPAAREGYDGEGVRMRYFGHACVLLETKDLSVLVDPLISYKYASDIPRFTYEDLPEQIDYVFITHNHHDHIVTETLLQLRLKIKNIVVPRNSGGSLQDPSMKLILKEMGFERVFEMDYLDRLPVPGGEIICLPFYGEHCDLDIRSKATYLVKLEHQALLMAADSSSIDPEVYRNVHKLVGDIDALFIGLECVGAPISWAYGPLFPAPVDKQLDQVRRSKGSDSDSAKEMISIFSPRHVYLYAMGLEPWLNYFMALQHGHASASDLESQKLMDFCAANGITGEKLFASKELIFNAAVPA